MKLKINNKFYLDQIAVMTISPFDITADSPEVFISYGKVITNKDGIIEIVGLEEKKLLIEKNVIGNVPRATNARNFNSLSLRGTALLPVATKAF